MLKTLSGMESKYTKKKSNLNGHVAVYNNGVIFQAIILLLARKVKVIAPTPEWEEGSDKIN